MKNIANTECQVDCCCVWCFYCCCWFVVGRSVVVFAGFVVFVVAVGESAVGDVVVIVVVVFDVGVGVGVAVVAVLRQLQTDGRESLRKRKRGSASKKSEAGVDRKMYTMHQR
jgi:hypothetical protein